jgi:hypothetical protein
MKHIFALSFFAILFSCSNPPASKYPDIIYVNGNFFTADSLHPQATAVAIVGDRILAVGNDAALKKLAGKETQIIDLQGAFAMPGFIEGHGHFNGLGNSLQNLNLINTKSWAEITGLVAEKVKSAKPGEWIEGRGWHQEKWSESAGATVNGYPYNTELSAAFRPTTPWCYTMRVATDSLPTQKPLSLRVFRGKAATRLVDALCAMQRET